MTGSGFFPDSLVSWNDTALATTFVNANQLTAIIPASLLSGFAQASIQVSTPEALGQTLPPQPFTTFLALPTNDIVYDAMDGLIYASIPGSAGAGLGNTVAGIDPTSGVIVKTIFVGSEPTRMALSSDGTQLFVGLNGAGAVRQVNLTTGTAGIQFSLGGGPGVYNAPYVAQGLAALPGQPNSVAVYSNNGVVTIFDSGVARAKTSSGLSTYFNQNYGGLSFGSSASTLYLNSQSVSFNLYALTIDSTGVTGARTLGNGGGTTLQYDNNRLYLSSGVALDAGSGNQLGQFSTTSTNGTSSPPVAASGPVISDSTLGRAWIVPTSYQTNNNQILAYDEATFNLISSMPVTGIGAYPQYAYGSGAQRSDSLGTKRSGLPHRLSALCLAGSCREGHLNLSGRFVCRCSGSGNGDNGHFFQLHHAGRKSGPEFGHRSHAHNGASCFRDRRNLHRIARQLQRDRSSLLRSGDDCKRRFGYAHHLVDSNNRRIADAGRLLVLDQLRSCFF